MWVPFVTSPIIYTRQAALQESCFWFPWYLSNTIRPALSEKLTETQVGASLVSCIIYRRSDWQITVCAPAQLRVSHGGQQHWSTSGNCPFPFTQTLATGPVNIQKPSDHFATVKDRCISDWNESDLVTLCMLDHVKHMKVNADSVGNSKYLGVHIGS